MAFFAISACIQTKVTDTFGFIQKKICEYSQNWIQEMEKYGKFNGITSQTTA
ncbi:MAG: hypothetical protein GX664_07730 [Bacteroidales bacterium]|jgi:hypothetical protein|nr:hypothetical protein [Bacteroidales bacterium]